MSAGDPIETERASAVLDGEASKAERTQHDEAMHASADYRTFTQHLRALKHATTRLEAKASPPEAVLARIEALRFEPSKRAGASSRVRAVGGVALAALLVAAALLLTLRWRAPQGSLSEELIADHVKYMPRDIPAEVASDDPHDILEFFAGRVDFDPVAPVLPGTRLIGGRACRIEGNMMQLLFYERDDKKLSLYVTDGPSKLDGCRRGRQQRGYQACGQRRGEISLMIVGDAPDHELQRLLRDARL